MSVVRTPRSKPITSQFSVLSRTLRPQKKSVAQSPASALPALPWMGSKLDLSLSEHIMLFGEHVTAGSIPESTDMSLPNLENLKDIHSLTHSFNGLRVRVDSVHIGGYIQRKFGIHALMGLLVAVASKTKSLSVSGIAGGHMKHVTNMYNERTFIVEDLTVSFCAPFASALRPFLQLFSHNNQMLTSLTLASQTGKIQWDLFSSLHLPSIQALSFVAVKGVQPLSVARFFAINRTLKSLSLFNSTSSRPPKDNMTIAQLADLHLLRGPLNFIRSFSELIKFTVVSIVGIEAEKYTKAFFGQVEDVLELTKAEDLNIGTMYFSKVISTVSAIDLFAQALSDDQILTMIPNWIQNLPGLRTIRFRKYQGDGLRAVVEERVEGHDIFVQFVDY